MKKVRIQSYQHIQRQTRKKKIESKNTPKKLESSPTKHFTESSFLLVSDPLEDLNFRFFGLSFFQQIFMKKVRVQSCQYIQRQTRKKRQSPKTPRKSSKTVALLPSLIQEGRRGASSPPKMRGAERPPPILPFSAGAGAAGPPRVEGRGAQGAGSPKPQPTSQFSPRLRPS